MSLFDKVPMPTEKITFKKGKNDTIYVYKTIRAYRNAQGKPTSDEVSIGKKDLETGMLIPNKRYFEVYSIPYTSSNCTSPKIIKNFGNHYILNTIAENLELKNLLLSHFPSTWKDILTCAFYMVCQGNVMMYIEDFCDMNINISDKKITSQYTSSLFSSIDEKPRMKFFKDWLSKRTEEEYLAYDVTSISSYSKKLSLLEYGYNRDNEKLSQINIGMFYGENSNLPVYYNIYNGSISDKTHLEFMMEYTNLLEIKNITFVMDKGFSTKDNILHMINNKLPFIMCVPDKQNVFMDIINTNFKKIKSSINWIESKQLYGMKISEKIYGEDIDIHVFYSSDKAADEEKEMYSRIYKMKEELEKLKKKKSLTQKFKRYFDIVEFSENNIDYEINSDKIDNLLKFAGIFAFITTNKNITSEELLTKYRNKDVIEKGFDKLKNHLDFHRLKTHLDKTLNGKMFVGFIALILRAYLINTIKQSATISQLTAQKVLLEMEKIKITTLFNDNRVLTPITKQQRTILESFNICEEDILNDELLR